MLCMAHGTPTPLLRDATSADAPVCAAIYTPYVTETTITFEEEPPDVAEIARRITAAQDAHVWIVAEIDGRVVGYAYGRPYKERSAYRYACEISVYLAMDERGRGVGTALFRELFRRLAALGYRVVTSCVTQPNAASERVHDRLGFDRVGTFERIGFKHDAWRDITWFCKRIGEDDEAP